MKTIKRKLNNQGSSIVMVIVALAFIGIIVGSLLSAAGAAYTLKRQELNAKDNFYYVEQAMQEIYTGVGMQTIEEMKEAYSYTIENMVRFDTELGTYKTISDEEANAMFKKEFMNRIMSSEYFKRGSLELANSLQGYVSDSTIKLDKEKLSVVRNTDSIILKDVTVTRNHEYKSSAGGEYIQTICADIVISEPDFNVAFNNLDADFSTLFDYAMLADMGVEIKQDVGTPNLSVTGNIYAASDYYNKSYNEGIKKDGSSTGKDGQVISETLSYDAEKGIISANYADSSYKYGFHKVSNKELGSEDKPNYSKTNGYVNDYAVNPKVIGDGTELSLAPFDGENIHSRYSGLYIEGSNVSIMADTIIVPGAIAVMNQSDLVVYGKGSSNELPQVWADDIVLGGNSKYDSEEEIYKGSSATFRADIFVKDDTQLDADGSTLKIAGSYYGYGDGTSRDSRVFFDTVDKENFQITAGEDIFNRGHFNSSSIVINGQNSSLDFSFLKNLYVAGRAYVEFSRYGTESTNDDNVKTTTYTYMPSQKDGDETNYIRDYKTGESIAYKTSQVIYNVSSWTPTTEKLAYDAVVIPEKLNVEFEGVEDAENHTVVEVDSFARFFPKKVFNGNMPVQKITVKNREYVYIDFDTAWKVMEDLAPYDDIAKATIERYSSLDGYKRAYAVSYSILAKQEDAPAELTDISKFDDFEYGDISYTSSVNEDAIDANVYSSGAITVNKGNTFSMTTVNDEQKISDMLSSVPYDAMVNQSVENQVEAAYNFSNDIEMEYNFVKWNLAHYKAGDLEKSFLKDVVAQYGEDVITPINKYLNFDKISEANEIKGKLLSDGATPYRIWVTEGDVTLSGDADLVGIVVTKGDVSFSDDVRTFTGIIISGGKIYVGKNMTAITAAPATCREILRQCMRKSNDDECKFFLNLFKEYAEAETEDAPVVPINPEDPSEVVMSVTPMVNVNAIGFSDIVSMENWTKTVGGAYGATE